MKIRYKLSTIGILFLFLISFFSFFIGAKIQRDMRITQDAKAYFAYQYSCEYTFYNGEEGQEIDLNQLKTEKGNIFLDSIYVFCNKDEGTYESEIMYSVNEKIKYPLVEGNYIDQETDNIILVGKMVKELTYQIDGKDYLDVEEEPYRVVGYLGYKNTELFDYKKIFYADRIGENLKRKIEESCKPNFDITIQSDKYDTEEILQELNEKETLKDRLSGSGSAVFDGTMITKSGESIYYLIVWLVCVLNAIMVSELWIAERMNEIRIRAAVGFSKLQIMWRLMKELLYSSMASGGVILVLYTVIQFIKNREVPDFLFGFLVLFVSAALFSIMVLLYPLYKLSKSNVVKIR